MGAGEPEEGVDDDDDEDDSEEGGDEGGGASVAVRADSGTDLRARESTSTVSSRSFANREIAKSFVCSFSRAAFRWRLRKSAWR